MCNLKFSEVTKIFGYPNAYRDFREHLDKSELNAAFLIWIRF